MPVILYWNVQILPWNEAESFHGRAPAGGLGTRNTIHADGLKRNLLMVGDGREGREWRRGKGGRSGRSGARNGGQGQQLYRPWPWWWVAIAGDSDKGCDCSVGWMTAWLSKLPTLVCLATFTSVTTTAVTAAEVDFQSSGWPLRVSRRAFLLPKVTWLVLHYI